MDALCGNVRASLLAGIHVRKVFAATFVISALLAAWAGIMLVSRSGNAVPRGVETYLTDCFVAVYIGTLISDRNKFNIIGNWAYTFLPHKEKIFNSFCRKSK